MKQTAGFLRHRSCVLVLSLAVTVLAMFVRAAGASPQKINAPANVDQIAVSTTRTPLPNGLYEVAVNKSGQAISTSDYEGGHLIKVRRLTKTWPNGRAAQVVLETYGPPAPGSTNGPVVSRTTTNTDANGNPAGQVVESNFDAQGNPQSRITTGLDGVTQAETLNAQGQWQAAPLPPAYTTYTFRDAQTGDTVEFDAADGQYLYLDGKTNQIIASGRGTVQVVPGEKVTIEGSNFSAQVSLDTLGGAVKPFGIATAVVNGTAVGMSGDVLPPGANPGVPTYGNPGAGTAAAGNPPQNSAPSQTGAQKALPPKITSPQIALRTENGIPDSVVKSQNFVVQVGLPYSVDAPSQITVLIQNPGKLINGSQTVTLTKSSSNGLGTIYVSEPIKIEGKSYGFDWISVPNGGSLTITGTNFDGTFKVYDTPAKQLVGRNEDIMNQLQSQMTAVVTAADKLISAIDQKLKTITGADSIKKLQDDRQKVLLAKNLAQMRLNVIQTYTNAVEWAKTHDTGPLYLYTDQYKFQLSRRLIPLLYLPPNTDSHELGLQIRDAVLNAQMEASGEISDIQAQAVGLLATGLYQAITDFTMAGPVWTLLSPVANALVSSEAVDGGGQFKGMTIWGTEAQKEDYIGAATSLLIAVAMMKGVPLAADIMGEAIVPGYGGRTPLFPLEIKPGVKSGEPPVSGAAGEGRVGVGGIEPGRPGIVGEGPGKPLVSNAARGNASGGAPSSASANPKALQGVETAKKLGLTDIQKYSDTINNPAIENSRLAAEAAVGATNDLTALGNIEQAQAAARAGGVPPATIEAIMSKAKSAGTISAFSDVPRQLAAAKFANDGNIIRVGSEQYGQVSDYFHKLGVTVEENNSVAELMKLKAEVNFAAKNGRAPNFTPAQQALLANEVVPKGSEILKWYTTIDNDVHQVFDQEFINNLKTALEQSAKAGNPEAARMLNQLQWSTLQSAPAPDPLPTFPATPAASNAANTPKSPFETQRLGKIEIPNVVGAARDPVTGAAVGQPGVRPAAGAFGDFSIDQLKIEIQGQRAQATSKSQRFGASAVSSDRPARGNPVALDNPAINETQVIKPQSMAGLTPEEIARFSPQDIAKLPEGFRQQLPVNQLSADQLQALSDSGTSLSTDQIRSLTPETIRRLPPELRDSIPTGELSRDQLRAMARSMNLPVSGPFPPPVAGLGGGVAAGNTPDKGKPSSTPNLDALGEAMAKEMNKEEKASGAGPGGAKIETQPSGNQPAPKKNTTIGSSNTGGAFQPTNSIGGTGLLAGGTGGTFKIDPNGFVSITPPGSSTIYPGLFGSGGQIFVYQPGTLVNTLNPDQLILSNPIFVAPPTPLPGTFTLDQNGSATYINVPMIFPLSGFASGNNAPGNPVGGAAGASGGAINFPIGPLIFTPPSKDKKTEPGTGAGGAGDASGNNVTIGGGGFAPQPPMGPHFSFGESDSFVPNPTDEHFAAQPPNTGTPPATSNPYESGVGGGAAVGGNNAIGTGGVGGGFNYNPAMYGFFLNGTNTALNAIGIQVIQNVGLSLPASSGSTAGPTGITRVEPRDPKSRVASTMPRSRGWMQLASFHARDSLLAFSPRGLMALPAGEDPQAGAFGKIIYSLVANGNSSGQALELQAFDPSGTMQQKDMDLPEGLVLEPVKQGSAKPVDAIERGANILRKPLVAYCVDYLKLPPEAGMLFRLAPAAAQQKFASIRSVLQAGRELAAAGKFHPDSDADTYMDSIRQYSLWAKIENWDQQKFGQVFAEKTQENAVAAKVKWTKQMAQAVSSLVPGRWRDISMVLDEASKLSSASGGRAQPQRPPQ